MALKPGKPICLAASGGKPVVILPGFPTSAIFTFHEFVAPVICLLGGRRPGVAGDLSPRRMAVKTNSEIGRTEYLLVSLVESERGLVAYPMGKGSGSVTTFSRADGFVTIGRHTEIVDAGQQVQVRPIGRGLADRRSGRDRQPLRRAGLPAVAAPAARRDVEADHGRQLRRPRGRATRRVRSGRHSFAGSRNRRVQPAVSDGRHAAGRRATDDARELSIVAATRDSKAEAIDATVADD